MWHKGVMVPIKIRQDSSHIASRRCVPTFKSETRELDDPLLSMATNPRNVSAARPERWTP